MKSHSHSAADKHMGFRSSSFSSKAATPTETGGDGCALFKPLFPSGHTTGNGGAAHSPNDEHALLEEAYQRGLQNGLKSGCEEAWAIARSSLRPGLRAFVQSVDSFGALSGRIQDHISENILVLAFAIVKQIAENASSLPSETIAVMKEDLRAAFAEASRFVLNLHPDDEAHLREFMAADDIPWPEHPSVCIKGDPSLKPGEIRIEEQSSLQTLSERIILRLTQLLKTHDPSGPSSSLSPSTK